MNIIISNKIDKPIYQQINDQIKIQIIKGILKKDEALPGMRSLASDLKVSLITTKRAYKDLEEEGYIYTVPGKGSFVAPLNKDYVYEEALKKIEDYFEEAIIAARSINLSKNEILEILENLLES
ncbi:GntR family transcriptional regulator [Peptoniphilus raoultii]|uniref:GntR family transcriptional regulator n=1 Tax=Peptoniphilus raoultii TaxID=1776387 RepID=UPI0008DAD663|nr:GntR family transcriptional regulator [Peptoniphilus raoultii]